MKELTRTALLVAAAFAGGAVTARYASARPGDDGPYAPLTQLARALVLVESEYVDVVERDRLLTGAIKGMVAELDPHSAYFTPEENAAFRGETQGKFGGVGVEVELRDEQIVVIAPIEGGPAERAGVRAGDRIVAVAGEPTRGVLLDKLVRKMRGEPGTTVEISVLTPGQGKPRPVRLVREEIKLVSVSGKRLAGDVAYLRVKQFQGTTHEEFLAAVAKVRAESKQPLRAVLLDLRNNPGGLVDQASSIADEMIGAGTIFTTRQRGKVVDEARATSGGALVDLPIVVLVNEYSASASELVAGALQDHRRATVVGATTFGKGSVQTIVDLPSGAGMKLTSMRYYTPQGRAIQAVGVKPDVAVEPTGVPTPPERIVRERDLEHALPAEPGAGATKAPPGGEAKAGEPDAGAPAADAGATGRAGGEGGVARVVPSDPTGSSDHVLSVGYQLAKTAAAQAR